MIVFAPRPSHCAPASGSRPPSLGQAITGGWCCKPIHLVASTKHPAHRSTPQHLTLMHLLSLPRRQVNHLQASIIPLLLFPALCPSSPSCKPAPPHLVAPAQHPAHRSTSQHLTLMHLHLSRRQVKHHVGPWRQVLQTAGLLLHGGPWWLLAKRGGGRQPLQLLAGEAGHRGTASQA